MPAGFGLKIYDASGTVLMDSTQCSGFQMLGVFFVASGASTFTNTYPSLAGFTPFLIGYTIDFNGETPSIAIDTALGYPRMIVTSYGADRLFALGCK